MKERKYTQEKLAGERNDDGIWATRIGEYRSGFDTCDEGKFTPKKGDVTRNVLLKVLRHQCHRCHLLSARESPSVNIVTNGRIHLLDRPMPVSH